MAKNSDKTIKRKTMTSYKTWYYEMYSLVYGNTNLLMSYLA